MQIGLKKLKSKIFRLVLDNDTIEHFGEKKSKVGFDVLRGLISEADVQVLSLEIDSIPRGLSTQQELRNLLLRFKSRFGRTIFVHLRNPTFLGYWLASVGDYIHVAPCQDIFDPNGKPKSVLWAFVGETWCPKLTSLQQENVGLENPTLVVFLPNQ